MRRAAIARTAVLVAAVTAQGAAAQTIARRVEAVRNGVVLMQFAAKPGVCGNGNGSTWTRSSRSNSGPWNDQGFCVPGPVRVSLGRADDATVSVRVSVGGS